MQQASFVWSGYPHEPHRPKHRLDELDDNDHSHFDGLAGTGTIPVSNGVKFSEANLSAANAFVAAAKRRKGNTGKVTLPPDFEPQFESLSLRGSVGASSQYIPGSLPDQASIVSPDPSPSAAPHTRLNSPPPRGRLSSVSSSGESSVRGRRDGTPIVSQISSSSSLSHRKRSSSRNRARSSSNVDDVSMRPAPRYDPARPHVVFVDSLSDSEEETENASDTDFTSDNLSALSTPGNSPSSSDTKDNVIPLTRNTNRPIQINKRLRDHLRRQAIMERMGKKPPTDGILATSPATTGGAGVRERGLVLYRPLSFGIVEEPDEEQAEEEESRLSTPGSEVEIQELPIDDGYSRTGELQGVQSMTDAIQEDMAVDEEMEID
ncbi:hypothetical protein P389DRAFT_164858 [Cystobasidium minutum MCA 4210]|uniref:uncharacterized protein n=1 Tax=Cystobasidium minutum MCA 4210 TaxID=1397322 RepID=UPI0034CE5109|eukprot:jgi/Rhomi1/164858/fgenesh1_kg.1_\